jgi:hypothetical protein
LDIRIVHLIATVIDACKNPGRHRRSHPPAATIRVLAALRRFPREGTPWHSLTATTDQASGATLRRSLRHWAETGVLTQVHAMLVGMRRGHPDLILDTCSDRAKRGTKDHVAVDGACVPVTCVATAANVNDTLVFERLFLAAFAVMARIHTVFAERLRRRAPSCPLPPLRRQTLHPQAWSATWFRLGPAALAGGAQQRLGAGEQAPCSALRPARLHRPVIAAKRMHILGCRQARSGILKTTSRAKGNAYFDPQRRNLETIMLLAHVGRTKLRPYGYACGNNHHHSSQHTGRHVLQWPSEDKDYSRNQRQQSGRVVCWPKIAAHFALHCLDVIHFYGEKI